MSKILHIENDEMFQRVLARVAKGHEITIVTRGPDALALFEQGEDFDLIFSDNDIDGPLTGEDVFIWVRINRPDLVSKYLFCSGNDQTAKVCQAAGIPCLTKPARAPVILAAVNSVLTVNALEAVLP